MFLIEISKSSISYLLFNLSGTPVAFCLLFALYYQASLPTGPPTGPTGTRRTSPPTQAIPNFEDSQRHSLPCPVTQFMCLPRIPVTEHLFKVYFFSPRSINALLPAHTPGIPVWSLVA